MDELNRRTSGGTPAGFPASPFSSFVFAHFSFVFPLLHFIFSPLLFVFCLFTLSACAPVETPAPTATSSPSQTATETSTPSPTPTQTPTPEPAWYQPLDESFAEMQYRYGLVNDPRARVYASLQDALDGNGNFGRLPNAPAYVSVVGEENRDGRIFYASYYGWIAAEEVELVTPSTFRGVLPTRPVDFRFGWVLAETWSTNAAGTPVRAYSRYEIVHEVPAVTENPGFVAVGPDEWLPDEAVALTGSRVPESAGEICRFLHVDLSEQVLRAFDGCQPVFATLVSTGKQSGWTYPGRFAVLYKVKFIQLTPPPGSISVYYLEGVPDFMTYSGDLGFHGAYWHDDFGAPVSHGCINLSPADARWLYEWSWIGDYVFISRD